MNVRWENRLFTVYVGLNRVMMVDGYNSMLPSGKHFLMWDFDDVAIGDIQLTLFQIQAKHELPQIWLLNTGRENNWHANCFKALPWEECRAIIAQTKYVDKKYLAIGILRGFFTLRYSPVGKREFKPAIVLPSEVKEDVNPYELMSFITYPKKRR